MINLPGFLSISSLYSFFVLKLQDKGPGYIIEGIEKCLQSGLKVK